MEFTKIKNGRYKFNGIDNWTNESISGIIIYQPYDKPLSIAWEVRFDNYECSDFMSKSLKECKKWLTL